MPKKSKISISLMKIEYLVKYILLYTIESVCGLYAWDILPYRNSYKKSYKNLVHQANRMVISLKNIKYDSKDNKSNPERKYAFYAFCTGTPKEIRLLIGISKLLQRAGCAALWSVCNSTPLTCGSLDFGKKNCLKCMACSRKMKQVLKIFHEEYFFMNTYVKDTRLPKDIDATEFSDLLDYQYKSINIGEIAKYSLFKRYKNDQVDETWRTDLVRNIKSFILTYEATSRAIQEQQITDVILMGGQYVNYRAVMLAAKNNNINYFTYENFGVNRLILSRNDECFNFPVKVNEAEISGDNRLKATKIFDDLRSGRYYHKVFNYESAPTLLGRLHSLENIISVFPNVSWDSATFYKDSGIFSNQYEWLRETIKFCIDTNRNLVIRIHPGEAMMSDKFKLINFINEWYSQLPENIIVYDSTDEISSYDIIERSNVSCVYVSTLGMEIPYYGVPVIVVGRAYYRDYGFTLNPQTKDDFFIKLAKYHDEKIEFIDKDTLYRYMLALQEYRRPIHYGEFLRYTGRQEFGLQRGHSFDFDESIYEGFPWEEKSFSSVLDTFFE